MAKRTALDLPGNTMLDVITFKDGFPPMKRVMTLYESNMLDKSGGVRHIRYQLGFSSY